MRACHNMSMYSSDALYFLGYAITSTLCQPSTEIICLTFLYWPGGFSGRSGGFNLSFVIDVSDNFDTTQGGTWAGNGNVQYGQTYFQGTDGGIVLTFSTLKTSAVELKVGISFLDLATAKQNLIEEIGSKDFSQVAAEASATWAKYLNSVRVEGGEQEDRTKFYTSLYHAFMAPTNFTGL